MVPLKSKALFTMNKDVQDEISSFGSDIPDISFFDKSNHLMKFINEHPSKLKEFSVVLLNICFLNTLLSVGAVFPQ